MRLEKIHWIYQYWSYKVITCKTKLSEIKYRRKCEIYLLTGQSIFGNIDEFPQSNLREMDAP